QAIAALLHDSVEDGPRTSGRSRAQIESEIAVQFGENVLRIVLGCTDTWGEGEKPDWWLRKTTYIQHLEDADDDILLVSNADKLHNAQCLWRDYQQMGDALWERFTGGKSGTLWYYQSLAEVFNRRRPSPLASELKTVVDLMISHVSQDQILLQEQRR
ncbi:MAG: HD domain-containing protein, partial [Gloeomargarita sp. HHBFW_bins_162]